MIVVNDGISCELKSLLTSFMVMKMHPHVLPDHLCFEQRIAVTFHFSFIRLCVGKFITFLSRVVSNAFVFIAVRTRFILCLSTNNMSWFDLNSSQSQERRLSLFYYHFPVISISFLNAKMKWCTNTHLK